MTQSDLDNTIKVLFYKLNDIFDKLHEAPESINALIANQDAKVDKETEKQLQPLSLNSEHPYSEDNLERKVQANLSPYNQVFEQPEE